MSARLRSLLLLGVDEPVDSPIPTHERSSSWPPAGLAAGFTTLGHLVVDLRTTKVPLGRPPPLLSLLERSWWTVRAVPSPNLKTRLAAEGA